MKRLPHQTRSEALAVIVRAALAGKRCPKNRGQEDEGEDALMSSTVRQLASEGRIRIEISGKNFRRIVILTGPHAGKRTAPDPTGAHVWKVIEAKRRSAA